MLALRRSDLPEIELEPGTRVIGDLHLDVGNASSLEPFLEWLGGLRGVPRLIILGDLFEYWIGPPQLRVDGSQRVVRALRALSERGTPVDLIPGNRDFLLEETFERASGVRLCEEALVGTRPRGEDVLFVHGDELCTRDTGHLRMRRVLRSGVTRWLSRNLPRVVSDAVARRLRRASRRQVGRKSAYSVEMVPEACRVLARSAGAGVLVCGHAHRNRDEVLEGGPRWLVVDDYGGALDTVEVDDEGELRLVPSGVRDPRQGTAPPRSLDRGD